MIETEQVVSIAPPTPTSIDRGDIGSRVLEVEEAPTHENEMAAVVLESEAENLENKDFSAQDEPASFDKAWNHPDPKKRGKWREAIRKEFHDMNIRQVWEVIDRCDMPKDR